MYVCMYVCVYVYTHTNTHTHIQQRNRMTLKQSVQKQSYQNYTANTALRTWTENLPEMHYEAWY